MASPDETGVPTRPRRRPFRRPPATPVADGAADPSVPQSPGDPDPPAHLPPSPRRLERPVITILEFPQPVTRSQASSSAARSSGHPGAQGAGTRTRSPRRVLYSYRPRQSRPSRRAPVEEYTRAVSSEVLPMGGEESGDGYAGHPGPQRAGTRIHVRQSVLYSDRPRRSRPRRPAPAEEHPSMVSSSELGRTVIDMPRSEELPLSDPPLSTPQTADEMRDESDDDELYNDTGDEVPPEPVGFGFGTLGGHTLRCIAYPPRPQWLGGVRGQGMLKEHGDGAGNGELSPVVTDSSRSEALPVTQVAEEKSTGDPDDDTEEALRRLEEYHAANPPLRMSEALDKIYAAELDVLTAQAAELGIEPPPPPRRHFSVDQARQEASAASHPQHSTVHRKPRRDASTEEIIENAKKWMRDEVMVAFQNCVGRRDDPKIAEYQLEELCHQCVNAGNYNKIFHHYNFTVKLKKANSDDWVVVMYFAEVKQMFGRKFYFCCALEPNENGLCYACQNQGVDDLKHPATGGFDMGLPDIGFSLWYTDE